LPCLLQDVMMPDVDGVELLRHVRGDDSLNTMPVVSARPCRARFARALSVRAPQPGGARGAPRELRRRRRAAQ